MLIKPFASIIAKEKEAATMSYLGTVEDNEDPTKMGRLKVNIPLYENMTTEELPWVLPTCSSSGNSSENCALNVPEVGSQVRVYFPNQDLTAPHYTGAELNETNRTTFFDEDYPHTYGYRDSQGDFIKVNKEKNTIHLQHSSTTNAKVSPDGSIQVALSNGSYFLFSNMDNFELNVKSVDIIGSCGVLTAKADSNIVLKTGAMDVNADVVSFSGDVSVGSGASGMIYTLGQLVTVKDGIIVSIETF